VRPRSPGIGRDDGPELSVVVPLYNECENLGELYRRLTAVLEAERHPYEIVLVDDGSRDETPALIDDLAERDPRVSVVHLSRNFGHQAAVSAGLDHALGRAVAVMDGDLQDPPELLPALLSLWRQGHEVVYAVRRTRREHALKRFAYAAFYRILRAVSDLDIPLDSGDFCLMDRAVVDVLVHLPERQRFVRGLRAFVGFRQVGLAYDRAAREAGEPKYTLRAMVGLAVDGLVSFSGFPLRLVTRLGLVSLVASLLLGCWVVADALVYRAGPRAWPAVAALVVFMGSVQLVSLGVLGEYVRRIFLEVTGRPTYIARGRSARLGSDRTSLVARRSPGSHEYRDTA
jgi:dolichol-phosphate mannosyltransferase